MTRARKKPASRFYRFAWFPMAVGVLFLFLLVVIQIFSEVTR